jgi:hypothetical protein
LSPRPENATLFDAPEFFESETFEPRCGAWNSTIGNSEEPALRRRPRASVSRDAEAMDRPCRERSLLFESRIDGGGLEMEHAKRGNFSVDEQRHPALAPLRFDVRELGRQRNPDFNLARGLGSVRR